MTLAAHAFRNFIRFRTHANFTRQHSAVCNGTFHADTEWDASNGTQKRVCASCESVAFIRMHGNVMEIEGYIPKSKLGLLNKSPDPLRTTTKKCIGCEVWAPAEIIKDGLCPSCRNSGPILSTIDYEEFYQDKTDTWQQGQRHEINSREVWVPPVPKPSNTERHVFNHIMWMFVRGVPESEIRLTIAGLRGNIHRLALFTRAKQAAAVSKDQHGWMTNHVQALINAGVPQEDIKAALSKLMWG